MDQNGEKAERAKEYLEASPPETLVRTLAERSCAGQPSEDVKEIFEGVEATLADPTTVAELRKKCEAELTDIFEASDLEVLTRFHLESEKRGLWAKLGEYGKRVVPFMQALVEKSI